MKNVPFALALVLSLAAMLAPHSTRAEKDQASLEQVIAQLATDDPDLQQFLLKRIRRQPTWSAEAAKLLERWLADPGTARAREAELTGILLAFANHKEVERLVAKTLTSTTKKPPTVRLLVLRILARLDNNALAESWIEAVGRCLEDKNPGIRLEALATTRACELRSFDRQLRAISVQMDLPLRMRLMALECLAPRQKLDARAVDFLVRQLTKEADPLLRLAAARTLGASRLDRKQLLALCVPLPRTRPTCGVLLLPAFAKSRDVEVGQALVKALNSSRTADILTEGDLDRLLAAYPAAVLEEAKVLRGRLQARIKGKKENLARVARDLPAGNEGRGKQVFFSAKASCAGCHRAAGKGGGTGPNLSRIAFLRSPAELLESTLLPSAYVAPEFRAWTVTTSTGRVFTGLIVQETSDALYLRTEPQARTHVKIRDIEEMAISSLSLMPEGYEKVLSRQELGDLIEFLSRQR